MTFNEISNKLKEGKIGKLPNYIGYFKWDYVNDCVYMQNGDYIKYNLDNEKLRTDFYYII